MTSLINKVKKCWENVRTNERLLDFLMALALVIAEQTVAFIYDCLKYWLSNH